MVQKGGTWIPLFFLRKHRKRAKKGMLWINCRRTSCRVSGFAMREDVELYTSMPAGWRRIIGAVTAPSGSMWIYNGKSLFSRERKIALLVKEECLE